MSGGFHPARLRGITSDVSEDHAGVIRLGADATPLIIGAPVSCDDGPCGELARVIVNPVARTVTDLVVAPKHHRGLGRLVPIKLVEVSDKTIGLRCTTAEFERLDEAEELQFLPYTDSESGYAAGDALAWPYYGLHAESGPVGGVGFSSLDAPHAPKPVVSDRIPLGDVEISRADQVHASDGVIGVVDGLVIDPRDNHVTHVLLQEGHLWGRKQVAIPISSLTDSGAGLIRVGLTKEEVRDLPRVRLSAFP
jgi:hypothetical protein